jgi:hypothetical protein
MTGAAEPGGSPWAKAIQVSVNHSALTGHTACNEDGACIQAPPQFRIPLQACGFGFIA